MTKILQQSRKNFEAELVRKAEKHKRKVVREQRQFDVDRQRERERVLRRIAEADARTYRVPMRSKV